jgi:hypothetical protein
MRCPVAAAHSIDRVEQPVALDRVVDVGDLIRRRRTLGAAADARAWSSPVEPFPDSTSNVTEMLGLGRSSTPPRPRDRSSRWITEAGRRSMT